MIRIVVESLSATTLRYGQPCRLPRGLPARNILTGMQETGNRRELEADRKSAGASLRPAVDWHSVNWKRVNRNVRRLQNRIAQAQKQGKSRKIRALQFILTRSYS